MACSQLWWSAAAADLVASSRFASFQFKDLRRVFDRSTKRALIGSAGCVRVGYGTARVTRYGLRVDYPMSDDAPEAS